MKPTQTHTEDTFPYLSRLKGKNGFSVPTDYFDSLENSILNKVDESNNTKVFSIGKVFRYAASVAAIAIASSIFFFGENDQSTQDEFDELTVSEYFEDIAEVDLELEESLEFDEIVMTTKNQ